MSHLLSSTVEVITNTTLTDATGNANNSVTSTLTKETHNNGGVTRGDIPTEAMVVADTTIVEVVIEVHATSLMALRHRLFDQNSCTACQHNRNQNQNCKTIRDGNGGLGSSSSSWQTSSLNIIAHHQQQHGGVGYYNPIISGVVRVMGLHASSAVPATAHRAVEIRRVEACVINGVVGGVGVGGGSINFDDGCGGCALSNISTLPSSRGPFSMDISPLDREKTTTSELDDASTTSGGYYYTTSSSCTAATVNTSTLNDRSSICTMATPTTTAATAYDRSPTTNASSYSHIITSASTSSHLSQQADTTGGGGGSSRHPHSHHHQVSVHPTWSRGMSQSSSPPSHATTSTGISSFQHHHHRDAFMIAPTVANGVGGGGGGHNNNIINNNGPTSTTTDDVPAAATSRTDYNHNHHIGTTFRTHVVRHHRQHAPTPQIPHRIEHNHQRTVHNVNCRIRVPKDTFAGIDLGSSTNHDSHQRQHEIVTTPTAIGRRHYNPVEERSIDDVDDDGDFDKNRNTGGIGALQAVVVKQAVGVGVLEDAFQSGQGGEDDSTASSTACMQGALSPPSVHAAASPPNGALLLGGLTMGNTKKSSAFLPPPSSQQPTRCQPSAPTYRFTPTIADASPVTSLPATPPSTRPVVCLSLDGTLLEIKSRELEDDIIHNNMIVNNSRETEGHDAVLVVQRSTTRRSEVTPSSPGAAETEIIKVKYRPHLVKFIAVVAEHFDIAIFSSDEQDYVDALLDVMDPSGQVFPKSRRYYRQHCTKVFNRPSPDVAAGEDVDPRSTKFLAKDLRLLGRQLDEVVLIDDEVSSGFLHPCNLLLLPTWSGDPFDTALMDVLGVLTQIAKSGDLYTTIDAYYGALQ